MGRAAIRVAQDSRQSREGREHALDCLGGLSSPATSSIAPEDAPRHVSFRESEKPDCPATGGQRVDGFLKITRRNAESALCSIHHSFEGIEVLVQQIERGYRFPIGVVKVEIL